MHVSCESIRTSLLRSPHEIRPSDTASQDKPIHPGQIRFRSTSLPASNPRTFHWHLQRRLTSLRRTAIQPFPENICILVYLFLFHLRAIALVVIRLGPRHLSQSSLSSQFAPRGIHPGAQVQVSSQAVTERKGTKPQMNIC